MPHTFDADALAGVLGHMNRDHTDDNLLIVRAFGEAGFAAATMTGFDGDGGEWAATRADGSTTEVRVAWPGGPISERREVRRGGRLIELTPTEFSLLRYLMGNAGRVLSKAQILDHVWNYDFGGDSNVVETYISYLRKKIDRSGEPLIHTMRGFGYSLRLRPR